MFDLSKMSLKELQQLHSTISMAMDERRKERRQELIQAVCDAMNALHKEFPLVELNIGYHCPECGYEEEEDAMYVLCSGRVMTPADFRGV